MITYRYGPYEPDRDGPWNMDRLMSVLSEMVMRYDMQLDDALRELINRGLPVNLFLKEGGMDDLVGQFMEQLDEQINQVQQQFQIDSAIDETRESMHRSQKKTEELLKKFPELQNQLKDAAERQSSDELYRMKWDMVKKSGQKDLGQRIARVQKDLEDLNTLQEGQKRFRFTGDQPLSRKEALDLLRQLADMEDLKQSMQQAQANGDLFNFDLEKLARYLGPESYQEFLERRERIMENLRKLMEEQGQVVTDQDSGEMKLSPASVRRIGRRALEEIFAALKSDDTGANITAEEGEGEQVSTESRPIEYGDSIHALDISSTLINAFIRTGSNRPGFRDIEIFKSRGQARSATVVLLDMSGSMMRADRFYYAKRMVMALDALIREDYKDDRLMVVGFGTFARSYSPAEIPSLQPFPVTMFDPHIRLRLDASNEESMEYAPLYFTNLQRGLSLSRKLLGSGETRNKQIILITDGVPTAHFEEGTLHINYPPSPGDFEFALRETKAATDDGVVINTFLLTSDWEFSYFGDESFIQQFAKHSQGRIFYPHPRQMDRMVLVDFIQNKKTLI
ncbi:MAG: VWA domain-containing protein [Leptospiraceae bacterium]|nr:VWA domain-containing protein [Leptospiraceae bacterium]